MRGVVAGIFKNFGWLAMLTSIAWWVLFIINISRAIGGGQQFVLDNAVTCISYMTAQCSIASSALELPGGIGYRPFLFWIGFTMIVFGYALQVTNRKRVRLH